MASLAMTSTNALGACKTTLRGELVQAPAAPVLRPAYPRKFLFFYLAEMTPARALAHLTESLGIPKSAFW
jgi:hypothetical protein